MKLDNFENWSKKIFHELKHKQKKKIILLAGASCSGKSFNAIRLAKQFGCSGKKVAILPSDNYHRSFALILTEKTLAHNKFPDIVSQVYPQVVKIVYNLTFNLKTQDKFNPQVMDSLKINLAKLMPEALATNLALALRKEYLTQNLDEPNAIDYKKLADDINILLEFPEKEIHFPQYMFEFAESVFSAQNVLCSKNYDYIIVEGMYVLRPELLRLLDNKNIVKSAVNCEISTMLTRLLNRNPSSQEQVITNFVTKTMPSYFKYIQPTLSQASNILNSTPEIDVNNQEKWQQKFQVEKTDIDSLLDKKIIKKVSKSSQIDFLLEYFNPKLNEHINITLRREANKLSKLTIKSKDNIKKSENDILAEFNIINILSENTKNVNFLIKTLCNAKYVPTILIRKERTILEYNNTKFKLDFIPELGWFIELFPCSAKEEKAIKKLLKLNHPKTETYFELYKQEEIKKEHQLKAIQYKVSNINEATLKHEFVNHIIKKTWLQFEDPKLKETLLNQFKTDIDLSFFGEIYIEESEAGYKLIMLDNEEGRVFFKQKIEPDFAKKLLNEFTLYTTTIKRYDVAKSLYFTAKIDTDENQAHTIRIRFDRNQYTTESATNFAKTFLNDDIEFKPMGKYTPFKIPEKQIQPKIAINQQTQSQPQTNKTEKEQNQETEKPKQKNKSTKKEQSASKKAKTKEKSKIKTSSKKEDK